ncbi:MAG: nickel-dependent hydrogenase large subunit [Polyangiaceae bacterium]|jgi:ech hydrogenase subunit E
MARTVVPFGPQHPVFPEPVQLKLVIEDEIVKEAIPTLGYVHRGLEKLAEIRDFHQMVQVVERTCGICSMIHAMCYCQGLEELMGLEVPDRARYLRTIWSELHRMHSHLLWLGLHADAFGFESLFMQLWKIREKILDINEATAGNRIIVSVNVVGGVRTDLSDEQQRWVLKEVADVDRMVRELEKPLLEDVTVRHRTVGVGVLTREQAHHLGAAGPVARASGLPLDMRLLKYAAFRELDFEPVVETAGDAWARCKVRYREVRQSAHLVRIAMEKLPVGDLAVPVKGSPTGEVVSRIEQPRGECLYYIKASGKKNLDRVRIRTPTFANVPPMLAMLPGAELANVPVIVLSIDPCISCTER